LSAANRADVCSQRANITCRAAISAPKRQPPAANRAVVSAQNRNYQQQRWYQFSQTAIISSRANVSDLKLQLSAAVLLSVIPNSNY